MFNISRLAVGLLVGAALTLASCTEPESFQASGVPEPSSWMRLLDTDNLALGEPLVPSYDANVDQTWWTHFDDPTLSKLLAEALENNKTLKMAFARIDEARAQRTFVQSSLLPQINAEASASKSNQGYGTFNDTIALSQVDIAATWELDLFGRNQALTRQAAAILQSQEASQQAIRVGLLAEVARTYFDMRNYERQIAIARQNLDTEKRTLQLIKAQMEGALASDFDVQRAGAQVSATEALIPSLQTAYESSLNRINVLLGYPPGTRDPILKAPADLKPLSSHILIAAPAKVLGTRPDIRVAERQFAASISAKDSAWAQMFPDISLTGLFGAQSATPFTSTPWGIGANLVQPLINWGRIQSQIDQTDAAQREAFLNYQQTILTSVENMENALSSYIHETARNASLTTGVAQNRRAADLAQQQYANGYTALLDVLVVQRNLLDAEASKASSDTALRDDLINIYTAAGGGWSD